MIELIILAIIIGSAVFVTTRRVARKLGGKQGCTDANADGTTGCCDCAEARPTPTIPAASLVKKNRQERRPARGRRADPDA